MISYSIPIQQVFSQKEPDMSMPHVESQPLIAQVARSIHKKWTDWEKLTAQADDLLKSKCPPPQPGEEPTCCEIHTMLRGMLTRLHAWAALLEDRLIEQGRIKRRDCILGSFTGNQPVLHMVQRLGPSGKGGYTVMRFSSGWFEMIHDLFLAESEERGIISA